MIPGFFIRQATADDAAGISRVLSAVVAERQFTAIERAWPAEEQARYLRSLSPREAFHVAVAEAGGEVVGYQSLDLYSPILTAMSHVGAMGTFLLPHWRRRGLGEALFQVTVAFARRHGYRKFVIQVRAGNHAAQAFYARLGFARCGRLTAQVILDGVDEDEVLMEYFVS